MSSSVTLCPRSAESSDVCARDAGRTLPQDYHISLTANCTERGALAWLVICPKLAFVGAVTGAENCTRSKALNVSARSWSVTPLPSERVLHQRHVQRVDGVEAQLAEVRRQRPDVAIELLRRHGVERGGVEARGRRCADPTRGRRRGRSRCPMSAPRPTGRCRCRSRSIRRSPCAATAPARSRSAVPSPNGSA